MTTEDLRRTLLTVVEDVTPSPDIITRARAGGRRRQYRRRRVVVAGVAAVTALGVTGAVAYQRTDHTTISAAYGGELMTRTTRGDLAGNTGFVTAAQRRFVEAMFTTRSRKTYRAAGAAHTVWIGRTPNGVAAYVVRKATSGERTAVFGGLVLSAGPNSGGGSTFTRVFASGKPLDGGADDHYATTVSPTGVGIPYVLAVDVGRPAYVSVRREYSKSGVIRTWAPVRYKDGAAAYPITPGSSPIIASARKPGANAHILASGTPADDEQQNNTLGWGPAPNEWDRAGFTATRLPATPDARGLSWAKGDGAQRLFDKGVTDNGFSDRIGPYDRKLWQVQKPVTPWVAYGETRTGDRVVVGETQYDADLSQVYAVIANGFGTRVVWAGPADRKAVLPVRVTLPDDAGWMVAAKGAALAYRTDSSGWQEVGRDAAMVPSGATAVRVDDTTVPLS